MKKLVFLFVLSVSFIVLVNVQAADAAMRAHVSVGVGGHVHPHFGHGHHVRHAHGPHMHGHYRPHYYRRPRVITTSVNYIKRDIGTGEVQQVIHVGPTPMYYPYYY